MKKIDPADLKLKPFHILDREWSLLVSGSDRPNPMTVAWGAFGTAWSMPIVTVYVRQSRHTFRLLEHCGQFTLNFLPSAYKTALNLCGTKSGRDVDKWEEAALTQMESETVDPPCILQSELAIECSVLFKTDLDPAWLPKAVYDKYYPEGDPHRMYIGRVQQVWAGDRFEPLEFPES